MQVSKIVAAAAALAMFAAPAFAAQNSAFAVTGEAGAVKVLRGVESANLLAGDALAAGDTVITRAQGGATLAIAGCEAVRLGANQSFTVPAKGCGAVKTLGPAVGAGAAATPQTINGLAVVGTIVTAGVLYFILEDGSKTTSP